MGLFTSALVPSALRALVDPKEKLRRTLGDQKLTPFPMAANRALSQLRSDDVDLRAVARDLAQDAALTVAILRHVNSAAFGLRHPVKAVEHAVSYLGRSQLESVVIAAAVRTAVPDKRRGAFAPEKFWGQAQRRAELAGKLASDAAPHTCAENVTAALLQDIAVPVLAHARGDYNAVLRESQRGNGALQALELDVIGVDHAEVGAWLCESWGLPQELANATAQHHTLDADTAYPSAAVASVLDHGDTDAVVESASTLLGIAPDRTVALLAQTTRSR